MPYSSISELPDNIKKILPTGAQTVYKNAFNSIYEETKDDGKAATAAWGAVKKAGYVRGEDGSWKKGGEASMPNNGSLVMGSNKIQLIELSAEEMMDENVPNARIPSFRLSKYQHPWYGEIEFNEAKLRSIIDNFHGDVAGTDLAVYETHDNGRAVGWIKDLERNGNQINLLSRMTEEGYGLLRDKKYKYASIEFQNNYVDVETGKEMGATLVGLALTNKPFITRQGSVSIMSMDDFNEEELESVSPVIVLEARYQKEVTMSDENKVTPQENTGNDTVPQDVVQLSRAEYNDLKAKYLALEQNTVELEKQTSILRAEARAANIERMMLSAQSRITDGKQLAPAVVDWARNFMKGAEINGVVLSTANHTEYMDAAINHLLSNVIPCTVPVQSNSQNEELSRPEESTEQEEFTSESIDRFWK